MPSRVGSFSVTYSNTSGHDLTSPLLVVTSPANIAIGFTPTEVNSSTYLAFLGISTTGPAGILRPGENITQTLYFQSAASVGNINSVEVQVFLANNSTPIDLEPYLLPATLADPNFAAINAALEQNVGTTWGQYDTALARNASLLPSVMGDNSDPLTLLDLDVANVTASVGTSISGIVFAPDPQVLIAGQTIQAINQTNGDSYSTYTLNDGSFVFPEVAPGIYTFTYPGAIISNPPSVTVASGQALTGVSLNLIAGAALSGVITSLASNAPIASAIVQAIGSTETIYTTTSDSNGDYEFSDLPADNYTLIANASGFARTFADNVAISFGTATDDLTMSSGSTITGTLHLQTGGPSGITPRIVAQPVGVADPNQTYYGTSSNNVFSLNNLPDGDYNIAINLAGYAPVDISNVEATANSLNVGTVNLVLEGTISGMVLTTNPSIPAANEEIGLYSNNTLISTTTSGSNGAYEFANLGAGTYILSLIKPSAQEVDPNVILSAGENLINVNISNVANGVAAGQAVTVMRNGQSQGTISIVDSYGWMTNAVGTYTPANPYAETRMTDPMSSNSDGAFMDAVFTSSFGLQPGFQYQWVQTVVAGTGTIAQPPYLDPYVRQDDLPFFWTPAEAGSNDVGQVNGVSGDEFIDIPAEPNSAMGYSISYETDLVAYSGENVYFLGGFTWGYSINSSGNTVLSPFTWISEMSTSVANLIDSWASTPTPPYTPNPSQPPDGFQVVDGNPFGQPPIQGQESIAAIPSCVQNDQYLVNLYNAVIQALQGRDSAAVQLLGDINNTNIPLSALAAVLAHETLDYDTYEYATAIATQLINQYTNTLENAQQDGICHPQPPAPPSSSVDGETGSSPGGQIEWSTGIYIDPNNIIGPAGNGGPRYVPVDENLPYTINFEDDPSATLPVQEATVTEQMGSELDWRTFRVGSFGWNGMIFSVTADSAYYQTTIDLDSTEGFDVEVTATIDESSGIATWTFMTIDPTTGQAPLNPALGFLPPDTDNGNGDAFVTYTIEAGQSDPTGTEVNAQATVIFGNQPPLNTSDFVNTLDAGTDLVSAVAPLPAVEDSSEFNVSWSGTDNTSGSGINSYSVYVSDNSSLFIPWLTDTTLTSAPFNGQFGHIYAFYSVATDNAGNVQNISSTAQVVTTVQTATAMQLSSSQSQGSIYGQVVTLTSTVNASNPAAGAPTGSVQFLVDGAGFGSPETLNNGEAELITSLLPAGTLTITAVYTSNSNSFANTAASPIVQVVNQATTTTMLTSSASTTPFGHPLTLSATLSAVAPGGGIPTGTVNFVANGEVIDTSILLPDGVATYTTTALPIGTDSIEAVYSGDANNLPSSAPILSELVNQDGTTVAAVSQQNPTVFGDLLTFSATVSPADSAAGIPTGTITFYDGLAPLGTENLVSGAASFTTSSLEVGTHTITATYSGDADFLASTSPGIYETVQPAPSPIASVVINNGQQQRSMLTSITVAFTGIVSSSALASAFTLQRMDLPNGEAGDNASPGAITVTDSTNASGDTVATLAFSGANTEGGSLSDGSWTLTINAAQITAGGIPMSSDYVQPDINRLFGDMNGTGTVDSTDLGLFGTTFGLTSSSSAFIAAFDSDGNGVIDSTDLGAFGTRFGLTI